MTGNQGQRQEAVTNGAPVLGVFHPFGIDVNKLVVVGTLGNLVDSTLVNLEPIGWREIFSLIGFQLFECNLNGHNGA